MTTLKQALKDPLAMQEFIKEHKKQNDGDEETIDNTIKSMVSKPVIPPAQPKKPYQPKKKKKLAHQTSTEELDES